MKIKEFVDNLNEEIKEIIKILMKNEQSIYK